MNVIPPKGDCPRSPSNTGGYVQTGSASLIHSATLSRRSSRSTFLHDMAWANVERPEIRLFTIPGTCWSCDRAWIETVQNSGDRIRAHLGDDVVLAHCVLLAMKMNPMEIAVQFNIRPSDLAERIAASMTMERLGGARG